MTADPGATVEPTVALVGGGPGDLDLLTLDAEAVLASAREVIADRSLAPLLAELAAEWRNRSRTASAVDAFAHQSVPGRPEPANRREVAPLDGAFAHQSEPRTWWESDAPSGAFAHQSDLERDASADWWGSGSAGGAFAHQSLADGLAAVELVEDDRDAGGLLLDAVGRGSGVVRLYRSDPWAHPAGDVERAALAAAAIRWSTVPGVLSELAVLAAAGIPVQVRTSAVTTTFVVDDDTRLDVPTDAAHTLVIRTADLSASVWSLAQAAHRSGIDGARPVAAVSTSDAGHPVVRTTVAGLADRDVTSGPGLVVVGLVAALDLRPVAARTRQAVGR